MSSDKPERISCGRVTDSHDVLSCLSPLYWGQLTLPGGIPYPLSPCSVQEALNDKHNSLTNEKDTQYGNSSATDSSLAFDSNQATDNRNGEVFSCIDIPTFHNLCSVVRDWEDIMRVPRDLPRGVEDRWRTTPPVGRFPVTQLTPKQFGDEAIALLRALRVVERQFEEQSISSSTGGGEEKEGHGSLVGKETQHDGVFLYSTPKCRLDVFCSHTQQYSVKEGGCGSRCIGRDAVEEPYLSMLSEGVAGVCCLLGSSRIRMPSIEETIGMSVDEAIRRWYSGLPADQRPKLSEVKESQNGDTCRDVYEDWLERHCGSRRTVGNDRVGDQDSCESNKTSCRGVNTIGQKRQKVSNTNRTYITAVVSDMPKVATESQLLETRRRLSFSESYKLCSDFDRTRFLHPRHMFTMGDTSPHVVVTRRHIREHELTVDRQQRKTLSVIPEQDLFTPVDRGNLMKTSSASGQGEDSATIGLYGVRAPDIASLSEGQEKSGSTPLIVSVSFYHATQGNLMADYDLLDISSLDDLRRVFTCCEKDNLCLPVGGHVTPPISEFSINGQLYHHQHNGISRRAGGGDDGAATPDSDSTVPNFSNTSTSSSTTMYPCKSMSETRLRDLMLPLLDDCWYIHQGGCAHRVVFNRIRTLNRFTCCNTKRPSSPPTTSTKSTLPVKQPDSEDVVVECSEKKQEQRAGQDTVIGYDSPYLECYPIRTYTPQVTKVACESCETRAPTSLVFQSLDLPKNPTQLCDHCKDEMLLDEYGNLIDNDVVIVPFELKF
eukprot:GHVQ01000242.1.p1 GENE.GHVQ01000242.1~~GHVQ01000242.1.p1  ORF type:complete len:772 (-),score=104.13 GHVQ01000242.1:355-2670(-)